jgi:periplasmic protein TonB
MAPVSKDTLEIASPAAGNPVSQTSAPSSDSSSPARSEVVSLEIPIKVHGSRVTEVVRGITPHTEPFEEQTQTMIVFPEGAVVKLSAGVNTGQMLVLTNLKTRQDAICRVLKVRANPSLANYVEVEFTHRQPGYWGISFPSDGPAEVKRITLPSPPAEAKPKSAPPSDISWAPAQPAPSSAPKPPEAVPLHSTVKPAAAAGRLSAPPPKAEPAFISIGTQEEVQVAASATAATRPGKMLEPEVEKFVAPAPKHEPAIEPPPAPPAIAPAEVSLTELQGDVEAAAPVLFSASSAAPADPEVAPAAAQAAPASSGKIFGRFAGSTALDSTSAAQTEEFGARLDLSGAAAASKIPGSGQNWTLIAAGIAVLVAGLAGGVYYVRSHAKTSGTESRVTDVPRTSAPVGTQAQGFDAAVQPGSPANPGSNASATTATSATAVPVPAKSGATASVAQPQPGQTPPAAASKAVVPTVTSDMMTSALNAHPTAAARAGDEPADEPTVTARSGLAEGNGNALADLPPSSSAASLPVPILQPDGPVKVGGQVQEPKLVASAMPVYPLTAKYSGVQGDVVIETTIDKDGNVTQMRVVSGPAVLRQSALDALRKWKYEPSKLDGQPISVQMLVTIKFRK